MKRLGRVVVIAALGSVLIASCGTDPVGTGPESAPLRLFLQAGESEDPRTYSVGRVQLRALDMDDAVLDAQIFEIDRATGIFDLRFELTAGPDRTLLIEPLGSAVLPDGERTNSGVALQAVVEGLDVAPDVPLEVTAILEPFIPDSVSVTLRGKEPGLLWKPMAIATSHRVRVIEQDAAGDSLFLSSRLVDLAAEDAWGSVSLDRLRSSERPLPFVGFQVQSVNRFAESAFSDTAFAPAP